jgi:hypothetical protein
LIFKYDRGRPVQSSGCPAAGCHFRQGGVVYQPDIRCIDLARYRVLLQRAVETVLTPIEQSVNGGKDSECLYLFPAKGLPQKKEQSRQFCSQV